MAEFLKKRDASAANLNAGYNLSEDPLLKTRVALGEHLTVEVWEDGKPRPVTTLSIFYQDGLMKAWVNDKAQGLSACVSAENLKVLLDVIDRGLRDGSLSWRRSDGKGKK